MTAPTPESNATATLVFKTYDVTDLSSLAPYFANIDNRCGIYILRFLDGSAYVGQTVDVVNRFSTHSRDWSKKLPDIAISKVDFMPCEPAALDETERLVIASLEKSVTLHNKRLTNWPGGRGDIQISRVDMRPILVPADRSRRSRLMDSPTNSKLRRHVEFTAHPGTSLLLDFMGWYIAESLPSPDETAGTMWTCTALPTTANKRRLLTLNVGGLEAIYSVLIGETPDTAHPWVWMNVAVPEGRSAAELQFDYEVCNATVVNYPSETVWSWSFDLDAFFDPKDTRFKEIFDRYLRYDDELFDLAYALNKRLMAKQPSMWIPSHNPYLASELLAGAFIADDLSATHEKDPLEA